MINIGFASQRLAIPKVMSWRLNLGRHSLRNLFSPRLVRAGALVSTARTRSPEKSGRAGTAHSVGRNDDGLRHRAIGESVNCPRDPAQPNLDR